MSSGVLLAAFDTVTESGKVLHYRRMAQIVANLVRKRLKVPVAIMTDKHIGGFDEVIITRPPNPGTRIASFEDIFEPFAWKNDARRQAFKLSPFDRTLMLDVDYFPLTDHLSSVLRSDAPFMIADRAYDPSGQNQWDKYRFLPNATIPQLWATVMCWDKNAAAHFEYANSIAENYPFYAAMFGFPKSPLRNDLVFSVVGHQLGYSPLPFKMWMTNTKTKLMGARPNTVRSIRLNGENNKIINLNSDVHIMDKTLAIRTDLLDTMYKWSL